MRSSRIDAAYVWFARGQATCVALSAFVAAVLKASPAQVEIGFGSVGPFLAAVLVWVQERAWILTPAFLALGMVIGWAKRWYGEPEIWRELQRLVDTMKADVFGRVNGDYQHHYRVTLYRYRRWSLRRDPRFAWLVPVVRSGHTSQNGIRVFSINPRQAGQGKGIAGRAWESEGAIHVQKLPDIRGCKNPQVLEEYARATNMPAANIRTDGTCSRSFWAVRVEAKGKPWGVLVIDSVTATISSKKALQFFKARAQFLSLLLQRA